MGLFSDVDWVILLIAGGVLLLGGDNRELLRSAGRMYAKAMRLKNELLSDLQTSLHDPPSPPVNVPPPNPTPGVWGVGTAHHVAPLTTGEAQASLARLQETGASSAPSNAGGGAS